MKLFFIIFGIALTASSTTLAHEVCALHENYEHSGGRPEISTAYMNVSCTNKDSKSFSGTYYQNQPATSKLAISIQKVNATKYLLDLGYEPIDSMTFRKP